MKNSTAMWLYYLRQPTSTYRSRIANERDGTTGLQDPEGFQDVE